jgi:hypothetical protein
VYSLIKGMAMATAVVVLAGAYYWLHGQRRSCRGRAGDREVDGAQHGEVHLVAAVRTQIFWGSNQRAPIGG